MESIKPHLRWVAVGIAACAVVFAFMSPRRTETIVAPDDSPLPQSTVSATRGPSLGSGGSSAATIGVDATGAGSPPASLAVYVCGAIHNAGVFHLPPGARVVDAVNKAGGMARDADPEAINLAAPLVDGMKIDVPRKGGRTTSDAVDLGAVELGAVDFNGGPKRSSTSTRSRSTSHSSSHKLRPGQTININTAPETELMQLPGVGPGLARRIVEYRAANGPFQMPDDLQNVSGVGPSKYAKMEAFLRV